MRILIVGLLWLGLVLVPAGTGMLYASPILVGPISLTGTGSLEYPDFTSYGAEGLGGRTLRINASGSANGHTVSINSGGIPLYGGLGPPPLVGSEDLVFNMPTVWSCAHEAIYNSIADHCGITIDGIYGYSMFSHIGGGNGLLQVWSKPGGAPYGDLLAEAQIISYVKITGNFNPCPPVCIGGNVGEPSHWTAAFDVNPTHLPEPGTWLIGIPLAACILFRRRLSGARR